MTRHLNGVKQVDWGKPVLPDDGDGDEESLKVTPMQLK